MNPEALELFKRLKRETDMRSGGYHKNSNFQDLLKLPKGDVLEIMANSGLLDWCDFELAAAILGESRPRTPWKDRGKYHKIEKLYRKALKPWHHKRSFITQLKCLKQDLYSFFIKDKPWI